MSARRILLIAVTVLAGAGLRVRADETPAPPNVAEYGKAVKSIEVEKARVIEIFHDKAMTGKEEDGWRAEVKQAALTWLNEDFDSLSTFGHDLIKKESIRKLPTPATALAEWLTSETEALDQQRDEALASCAGELAKFAEDRWLKAEKPDDLQPVTAAFAELDALDPSYLSQTNVLRAEQSRLPEGMAPGLKRRLEELRDPRRVDAFFAAVFAAGKAPMIFPHPKTDLEGFAKTRIAWGRLARIGATFPYRPRVAERIAELNAEYFALRASAEERLNSLVWQNAPAEEFEAALTRYDSFVENMDPPVWDSLAPQPPPVFRNAQAKTVEDEEGRRFYVQTLTNPIQDYRALLEEKTNTPPGPNAKRILRTAGEKDIFHWVGAHKSGDRRAYYTWLEFCEADEQGGVPENSSPFWGELETTLFYLPATVQVAIKKRLMSMLVKRAVAAVAQPEEHPVAALIASLDAIAWSDQVGVSRNSPTVLRSANNVKGLIDAWKSVERGEASHGGSGAPDAWRALAESPECHFVFALREKAVRRALAEILPSQGSGAEKDVPIEQALKRALEKCAINGDWAALERLLALDFAANLLPAGENHAWQEIEDQLKSAAAKMESESGTARELYAKILDVCDDRAIRAFAVRKLKEISENGIKP